MDNIDQNEMLTPSDIARILKISKSGVYNLLKRGEIPYLRVGKKIRVPAKSLNEFIESQTAASHT